MGFAYRGLRGTSATCPLASLFSEHLSPGPQGPSLPGIPPRTSPCPSPRPEPPVLGKRAVTEAMAQTTAPGLCCPISSSPARSHLPGFTAFFHGSTSRAPFRGCCLACPSAHRKQLWPKSLIMSLWRHPTASRARGL